MRRKRESGCDEGWGVRKRRMREEKGKKGAVLVVYKRGWVAMSHKKRGAAVTLKESGE